MRQNLNAVQFIKLCLGLLGCMRLGIVLLKQRALTANQSWVLLGQLFVDAVTRALAKKHAGDILDLTIFRAGRSLELKVKLGEGTEDQL